MKEMVMVVMMIMMMMMTIMMMIVYLDNLLNMFNDTENVNLVIHSLFNKYVLCQYAG